MVALGTNVGSVLMELETVAPLPVKAMPLLTPMQALASPGSAPEALADALASPGSAPEALADVLANLGALTRGNAAISAQVQAGASFISAIGDCVYCCTALVKEEDRNLMGTFRPARVNTTNTETIASGMPASRAMITCSYDGTYVAVVWPIDRKYAVYQRLASGWKEFCKGATSCSIAWHSSEQRFALFAEVAAAPAPTPTGKAPKKGSKAALEAEAAAVVAAVAAAEAAASAKVQVPKRGSKAALEAEAAAAAAEAAASVKVLTIVGGATIQTTAKFGTVLVVQARQLCRLFKLGLICKRLAQEPSGGLGGVTFKRTLEEGSDLLSMPSPSVLHFFSWETGDK
eukprot:gene23772-9331_t